MESFFQDFRFGLRALLRRPSFTIVAAVTLSLGMGANVTMLSFAEALLRHPFPYEDPETLMVLWRETDNFPRSPNSFPTHFDWKERNRVFSLFALFRPSGHNLTGPEGDPERIPSLMVSADFCDTLGIEPHLGRVFAPEDDRLGAERTVVLSYELWQRRFGGDGGLVEKTILLGGELYTVIGILPRGLSSETFGDVSLGDLWLPVGIFYDRLPIHERDTFDDVWAVGRLQPGVTVAMARDDMARIARELGREHPLTHARTRVRVSPVLEVLVGDLRPTIYVLLVSVGFVLLIAGANLVNLLLTRAAVRQRETAMRTALGASRQHLARQVLSECLILAFLGSVLGLAIGAIGIRVLPSLLPGIPYADRAALTPQVLLATALLCVAVAIAIGLVPTFQNIRSGSLHVLGSPALPVNKHWRRTLVSSELALVTTLLIGAGLVISSFRNLREVEVGFSSDSVLVLLTSLPESKYGETAAWASFFDETLERLGSLSGVESVALLDTLPLTDELAVGDNSSPVVAGDRPMPSVPDMANTIYHMVSPNLFQMMEIPLLEGDTFTAADDDRRGSRRVVIVSETLARHFWGERSPIGERISFELKGTARQFVPRWREVVGVAKDIRNRSLLLPPKNSVYVPYTQMPLYLEGTSPEMALLIKTSAQPSDMMNAVRQEVYRIDPNQPLHSVRSFKDVVDKHLDRPRMVSTLLMCFAGLGLVLAVVGVYGVISYMVVAQMHDIGVRMALGAAPSRILAGVLRQGFLMVVPGVVLGLVLAWNVIHLMSSLLYGVDTRDPWVYAIVSLALAAVAFLANLIPAVQAMRLEPSKILRWE